MKWFRGKLKGDSTLTFCFCQGLQFFLSGLCIWDLSSTGYWAITVYFSLLEEGNELLNSISISDLVKWFNSWWTRSILISHKGVWKKMLVYSVNEHCWIFRPCIKIIYICICMHRYNVGGHNLYLVGLSYEIFFGGILWCQKNYKGILLLKEAEFNTWCYVFSFHVPVT